MIGFDETTPPVLPRGLVMRNGEPTLRADLARIVDAKHQENRRNFRGGQIEWDNMIELEAVAMKLWLRSL